MRISMPVVTGVAVVLAAPTALLAQESTALPGPGDSDDIVVTAQRRPERLQDVPLSVVAVSQQAIQNSGFSNAQDIQYLSPSVQVNRQGSEVYQIRGVGTATNGYYLEQSVGVVVDGVPIALPSDIGLGALPDVAQVEVLRGPQGTLFGKNASAGLINVTTRAPSLDEWSVEGRGSYGQRDDRRASLIINLPITPTLALLAAGTYQHQDGFVHNLLNGETLGSYTDRAVRVKLLWEPSSSFTARLSADLQRRSGSDPAYVYTFRTFGMTDGYGSGGYGIVPGPDNTTVAQDTSAFFNAKRRGASLQLGYSFGAWALTSITAYRKVTTSFLTDDDGGPAMVSVGPNWSNAHQFSQELRLETPRGKPIEPKAAYFTSNAAASNFSRPTAPLRAPSPPAPLFPIRADFSGTTPRTRTSPPSAT
jgi:iron complex outermembrane receptor protein